MAQAERTSAKAKLAERLITGLSGEFQRWTVTIRELTGSEGKLCCSSNFIDVDCPRMQTFSRREQYGCAKATLRTVPQ